VVLKRKTGFIKYALQFGYKVAPVYVFGEEKTLWKIDVLPKRFAMWLNKFNIPATVFFGKYGLLPDDDIDLRVVVGEPLVLPCIPSPSAEEVSKHHARYVKALRGLFDRHKEANGVAAEVELEIM
jgi:2-acylglycerol O-acyltransferase 2